jgi:hypothetical protein
VNGLAEIRGKIKVDEIGGLDSIVSFPMVILETIFLLLSEESLKEHANLTFSFSGRIFLLTLAIVDFPGPVWDEISLVGRSN